ncbi:MAG: hypothetical protein CMP59_10605 [Flavobacteriales bacterium]|nr:hypothetical protein [Flavobacteriales bacterium]
MGRWLESNNGTFILCLNLIDQSFELFDKHFNSLWLVSSNGKSIHEVESQIGSALGDLGLSDENWNKAMHYEIPNYGLTKGPIERLSEDQVEAWKKYRGLANYACMDLLGSCQADSEIRIWPHHFDTGVYFQINDDLGIGFGLAMKDDMANDAYFYLSAYADSIEFDYSKFRTGDDWEWKNAEWKGAIKKIGTLSSFDQKAALEAINDFSKSAIEQLYSQLA